MDEKSLNFLLPAIIGSIITSITGVLVFYVTRLIQQRIEQTDKKKEKEEKKQDKKQEREEVYNFKKCEEISVEIKGYFDDLHDTVRDLVNYKKLPEDGFKDIFDKQKKIDKLRRNIEDCFHKAEPLIYLDCYKAWIDVSNTIGKISLTYTHFFIDFNEMLDDYVDEQLTWEKWVETDFKLYYSIALHEYNEKYIGPEGESKRFRSRLYRAPMNVEEAIKKSTETHGSRSHVNRL